MEPFLSAAALARALNVSPSTVRNWADRQHNPLTRHNVEGKVRFLMSEVDAFARSHPSLRAPRRSTPARPTVLETESRRASEMAELFSAIEAFVVDAMRVPTDRYQKAEALVARLREFTSRTSDV